MFISFTFFTLFTSCRIRQKIELNKFIYLFYYSPTRQASCHFSDFPYFDELIMKSSCLAPSCVGSCGHCVSVGSCVCKFKVDMRAHVFLFNWEEESQIQIVSVLTLGSKCISLYIATYNYIFKPFLSFPNKL